MSRGLSSAAKAELYAARTTGVWLVLLTISHTDFAATLRYVNDRQSVVSGGDTYAPLAFQVRLPKDADAPPRATIVLDNVDQATIASVRSITTPPTVAIEVIRRSAPDTILAAWPNLQAVSCVITATAVEFELGGDRVLHEAYPGTTFSPLLFPAGFAQ